MSAIWRRGPDGTWLLYGRVSEFGEALDGDRHVTVRLKDGSTDSVEIEYHTNPNFEGYSYAWPTGTRKGPREPVQLPIVIDEQRPQYVSTKSYRRRLAIRRRNRTARGPAHGP